MIIGIGHDITSIERVEKILANHAGNKFLQRIFSNVELEAASGVGRNRRAEYVAGRFAAKEAVSKAFGCGIGHQLGFHDITITKLPSGQPICKLSDEGLHNLGLTKRNIMIHLSITHESKLASAYVIVEDLDSYARREMNKE